MKMPRELTLKHEIKGARISERHDLHNAVVEVLEKGEGPDRKVYVMISGRDVTSVMRIIADVALVESERIT